MADNADITQSQAGSQSLSTIESRDTRPRWMQEVNRLCTDSRALRVDTVLWAFHTIEPFSF